jgi:hypothetical protein
MVLIDSYSESYSEKEVNICDSSLRCPYHEAGQAITMPDQTYKVTSAKFYLKTTGSPDPCTVKIYNCTGTPGTDGKATGSCIAESESKQFSRSTCELEEFVFTGVNQIILNANSNYTIEVSHHLGGSSNYYMLGYDENSPVHAGNAAFHDLDDVSGYGASDICFYLYGDAPSTYTKSHTSDTLLKNTGIKNTYVADAIIIPPLGGIRRVIYA